MDKDEIKAYQTILNEVNLYDGPIDGIFGPKTSEASSVYEDLSEKGYTKSQMFRHSTGAPHMKDSEWDDYIKTGDIPKKFETKEEPDIESKDWTYLGEIKKQIESTDWDDPKNQITVQNVYGKRWKIHAENMRDGDEEKLKIAKRNLDSQLWWRSIQSQRKAGRMIKAGYKLPPALQESVGDIYPATQARFGAKDLHSDEAYNLRVQMDRPSMTEIRNYLKNATTQEDSVINSLKKEDEWKVTDEEYKSGK